MKNLQPYVEISILTDFEDEKKEFKWIKVKGNDAYIKTQEQTSMAHYKIDKKEFIKILEHYKDSMPKFVVYNIIEMTNLCYIKFVYNDDKYEFCFNYSNNTLLQLAKNLYRDLNDLIEFHSKDFKDNNVINKNGIQSIIDVLEKGKPYEEILPKTEDALVYMGGVHYDDKVLKLFRYMPFCEGDYNKNIQKIIKKEISKLSIKETKQYLTYIYRKERFCEGFLKTYIDNGVLLKLLRHLLEIC